MALKPASVAAGQKRGIHKPAVIFVEDGNSLLETHKKQ